MYKITIMTICLSLTTMPALATDAPTNKQAKKIMMSYGKALKSQMKKAMKAGGPIAAIGFCNVKAPSITADAAKTSGWNVARTSLKLRNNANKPDDWELKVLKAFEKRKASGEPVKPMMYSEVIENNGKKTFRFMKAIPTGEVCTKCHGEKINKNVEAKLLEFYPDDKARGYKMGDIRGAFTLSKSF